MDRYCYRSERGKSNPSFSATLLDAIYRSIDEGDEDQIFYKETMSKKKNSNSNSNSNSFKDENNFRERSCMVEKWMENKGTGEVVVRRKSAGDFERNTSSNALFFNSTSSSTSDSSSGGGFSSSETDDYGASYLPSCYGFPKPKPIKTTISPPKKKPSKDIRRDCSVSQPKPEQGGGFLKTKSRALKIYSDLKKAKQPISPGGRLASFLNTLFTAGNAKKAEISSTGIYDDLGSKSVNASTCSSASSYSRSCLSNTPSSRGKSSNNTKRSVRFYPLSIILDEDSQPCGHKNLYDDRTRKETMENYNVRSSISEEVVSNVMDKNRRVEEAARNLLRNYRKNLGDYEMRDAIANANREGEQVNDEGDYEEEEDDEDAASYASSDLFELDNLSANGSGMDRYRQELPVYETTHLDTNRAIASGFIL